MIVMKRSDSGKKNGGPGPILEAESRFLDALETLDVDEIMACWADSDDVTLVYPGTDLAIGPEDVRSAWESVRRNTSRLETVLEPVTAARAGSMGWTFLVGTLVSTHGDETLSVEVYVTNIYRLEAGEWKLVHHHATPAPHQPSYLEQRLN